MKPPRVYHRTTLQVGRDVILDPAFGRTVATDLERASPFARALLGDGRTKTPLVDVMAAAGLDPQDVRYAIVTHVHWDHVGALGDLPNARVLIGADELEWARTLHRWFEGGVMPHHLARAKARIARFQLEGPPVEGFDRSFDLFGDGAVVAVPMPGHTPGHVAWLVRSAGKTYFFVGDTAWTLRGVELPAHKTAPVDADLERVAEQLGVLNAFLAHRPDVVIVPAHDGAAWDSLPRCGSAGTP